MCPKNTVVVLPICTRPLRCRGIDVKILQHISGQQAVDRICWPTCWSTQFSCWQPGRVANMVLQQFSNRVVHLRYQQINITCFADKTIKPCVVTTLTSDVTHSFTLSMERQDPRASRLLPARNRRTWRWTCRRPRPAAAAPAGCIDGTSWWRQHAQNVRLLHRLQYTVKDTCGV